MVLGFAMQFIRYFIVLTPFFFMRPAPSAGYLTHYPAQIQLLKIMSPDPEHYDR
jgi:hypothetical protein